MNGRVLLDTGPLVAYLRRRDQFHGWAREQLGRLRPPLLTCEAVLTEACYLLRNLVGGGPAVMELLDRGILRVAFQLSEHIGTVSQLLDRYADVPMSLADACLVRMAELHQKSSVLTFDSDFRRYRKHRRQVIPLVMPDSL